MEKVSRRTFIKTSAIATLGMNVLPDSPPSGGEESTTIRIGVIGTGNRGTSHVNNLLTIDGIEITAVCDLVEIKAANAVYA